MAAPAKSEENETAMFSTEVLTPALRKRACARGYNVCDDKGSLRILAASQVVDHAVAVVVVVEAEEPSLAYRVVQLQ